MDLTQLANLGEFIGGVAVLVTLIYLAVQVRQNTQTLRRSNARQTSLQNSDALRGWADSSELLVGGFHRLPDMTPAERLRFNLIWIIWMQGTGQTFEDERNGVQDPGFSRPYRLFLRGLLATPEGRDWWWQLKDYFDPRFQEEMQKMATDGSEELATAARGFFNLGGPGAPGPRPRAPLRPRKNRGRRELGS